MKILWKVIFLSHWWRLIRKKAFPYKRLSIFHDWNTFAYEFSWKKGRHQGKNSADIVKKNKVCRRFCRHGRHFGPTCRLSATFFKENSRHLSARVGNFGRQTHFSRKMSAQMSADRKMSAVILAPTPLPPLEINLSAVGIGNSTAHVANHWLSKRSFHHRMVTRFPNNWWASSWHTVAAMFAFMRWEEFSSY